MFEFEWSRLVILVSETLVNIVTNQIIPKASFSKYGNLFSH